MQHCNSPWQWRIKLIFVIWYPLPTIGYWLGSEARTNVHIWCMVTSTLTTKFHLQDALQEAAGSGLDPELRLLKLLLYFVPEHLAKQGSLGIQGREVLYSCKDGGEPLGDELAYAVLVG
jgi:hypothetical protein